METTDKKECPKCHSENIVKLADVGSDKGNGSYTFEPEEVLCECKDCGKTFPYKK